MVTTVVEVVVVTTVVEVVVVTTVVEVVVVKVACPRCAGAASWGSEAVYVRLRR